jgi:hypothetical protein
MRFVTTVGLLMILAVGTLRAQDHPKIPERPPALKALDGNWVMSGDVMGKPVTYRLVAGPTLQGTFTELHMSDIQVPSQYEARVFIGYDADRKKVIAHWMDSFGAKYSIPHGTGRVTGNSVQFTIPYESGSFRDTFTYNPASKTWLFVLEAAQPDGTWKHFARYSVHRQ